MTTHTLKIGKQEFVVIAKRDFLQLSDLASRQTEDDYWTRSALDAETDAKSKCKKPIPIAEIEREMDARGKPRQPNRRKIS